MKLNVYKKKKKIKLLTKEFKREMDLHLKGQIYFFLLNQ